MIVRGILYLLLLLLWLGPPVHVRAETPSIPGQSENTEGSRNIYAGDVITLRITTLDFSSDDLREKFQGFEILEILNEPGGYVLSLRTFDIGEKKIVLGDKEILIDVRSTLDDIQRDGVFEGDNGVIGPGLPIPGRTLFYTAAGVFILSGCFVIRKTFIKRKTILPTARQLFIRRSGALSTENDNFFVDLTFYFKEYIESLYQCRIIGKTSGEIVSELKGLPDLEPVLPEICVWLTECDRLKFTGVRVSREAKRDHYGALLELVEKIELQKEGAA